MTVFIEFITAMRYLGIDYGEKRIGLAVSDEAGRIAFPRATAASVEDVLRFIAKAGVKAIVIGLPRMPGRRDSAATRAVRRFAARLAERVQLPIAFEDEAFTTAIAERTSAPDWADAAAAALILQSYLDRLARN